MGKTLSDIFVTQWRDYMFIVLGMMVYAIGFTVFILPHEVVIGGMSGFGTLVFYFSGQRIPVAVAMYGANLVLLACGYRVLGRVFVMRTVFGATILSAFIGILEGYFTSHSPLVPDMTFSVLMGSVFCGVGIGIYFTHGGTAGGTDIIAAVMDKITDISVGRTMMIVDMAIVALSFFLPFDGDMTQRVESRTQTIIYGWTAIFVYSYITDQFIGAGRRTIQYIILSDKWERISYRITHETGRGVTLLDAKGYWTMQQRTLMLVWCRMTNVEQILSIVFEEDPGAYVTDINVRGVRGNGFDRLRVKSRHGVHTAHPRT